MKICFFDFTFNRSIESDVVDIIVDVDVVDVVAAVIDGVAAHFVGDVVDVVTNVVTNVVTDVVDVFSDVVDVTDAVADVVALADVVVDVVTDFVAAADVAVVADDVAVTAILWKKDRKSIKERRVEKIKNNLLGDIKSETRRKKESINKTNILSLPDELYKSSQTQKISPNIVMKELLS